MLRIFIQTGPHISPNRVRMFGTACAGFIPFRLSQQDFQPSTQSRVPSNRGPEGVRGGDVGQGRVASAPSKRRPGDRGSRRARPSDERPGHDPGSPTESPMTSASATGARRRCLQGRRQAGDSGRTRRPRLGTSDTTRNSGAGTAPGRCAAGRSGRDRDCGRGGRDGPGSVRSPSAGPRGLAACGQRADGALVQCRRSAPNRAGRRPHIRARGRTPARRPRPAST